jgi:hypothetical protein
MIQNISLPPELNAELGSENQDFAVKADHLQPIKKSLSVIIIGVIWAALNSVFVFSMILPILRGREVEYTVNNVPAAAGPGNYGPVLTPAVLVGVLFLIGVGIIGFGIYSLFNPGGYFVGTSTRLLNYRKGNIKSIGWEKFSGKIWVDGDAQKGNIALQMKTGKMIRRKNGPAKYVPDVTYISGIPSVSEIERICKKRIKENDLNPLIKENNSINLA